MKRTIVLIFIMKYLISHSYSQVVKGYGVKGGISIANQQFNYNYTGPEPSSEKNRIGFTIGAYIELFEFVNFNFQPELLYVQKGMIVESIWTGGIWTGSQSPTPSEFNNRLYYLSLPLLIKYSIKNSIAIPYLVVGPRIDFMISYNSEESNREELYEEFNRIDFGGDIGVGIEFGVMDVLLLFELRYSPNFTASFNNEGRTVKNISGEIFGGLKF
jgi:hypothetical protein